MGRKTHPPSRPRSPLSRDLPGPKEASRSNQAGSRGKTLGDRTSARRQEPLMVRIIHTPWAVRRPHCRHTKATKELGVGQRQEVGPAVRSLRAPSLLIPTRSDIPPAYANTQSRIIPQKQGDRRLSAFPNNGSKRHFGLFGRDNLKIRPPSILDDPG